jgi:hypothetical protein
MNNLKGWLHGLAAAVVSSFATAASGVLALPTVFTLDRNGFTNMIKLAIPAAMLAAALYLKQSPVPPLSEEKKA